MLANDLVFLDLVVSLSMNDVHSLYPLVLPKARDTKKKKKYPCLLNEMDLDGMMVVVWVCLGERKNNISEKLVPID